MSNERTYATGEDDDPDLAEEIPEERSAPRYGESWHLDRGQAGSAVSWFAGLSSG